MFVDWFMKHQKYKRILQSRLKMNQNKCDVAFSGDIHISRMSTIGQLSSFAPNPARSLQRLKFAAITLSINTIHNGTRNKFCFFLFQLNLFYFLNWIFYFHHIENIPWNIATACLIIFHSLISYLYFHSSNIIFCGD